MCVITVTINRYRADGGRGRPLMGQQDPVSGILRDNPFQFFPEYIDAIPPYAHTHTHTHRHKNTQAAECFCVCVCVCVHGGELHRYIQENRIWLP